VDGNVNELDLNNRNMVSGLFSSKMAKVILFYKGGNMAAGEKYLHPMQREFDGKFAFYTAGVRMARDAMGAFGLTDADLPAVVLHVSQPPEKKYRYRSSRLSVRRMRKWLKAYLAGQLKTIDQEAAASAGKGGGKRDEL
jgi:hypothetical protein